MMRDIRGNDQLFPGEGGGGRADRAGHRGDRRWINAASEMTARMVGGVLQADGSTRPEPRMDLQAVADTFMAMVRLPLTANVLFTTVMATKMPYVGRG
jgi:hypothetical protein